MSVKMGNLFVVTASKVLPCHLGNHCLEDGYIEEDQEYAQIINNKVMPTGGMVTPEQDADLADRGEDKGKAKQPRRRVNLKTKFVVTRYHFSCLSLYLSKLGTFKQFAEGRKGRPRDPRLAELTPEVKAMRRHWAQMRSRAMLKAIDAKDILTQLQQIGHAKQFRDLIDGTGVPLNSHGYPEGFVAVYTRHICPALTDDRTHELGEDYHCIHCNRCYRPDTHVHV